MYGEIAYVVLTQLYGKNVEAVIDNKLREVSWADIKVIRTGELEKYSGVDILVCAANAFGHIVREAEKYQDRDIRLFDCREILADYQSAREQKEFQTESVYVYGGINLDEMILK